jgi:PAS domain S-box-containing protein
MVFEFASDGYRQALGGRDVIGRPYRQVLPEVVGQPPFEALCQVLQTGEPRQARGEESWLRRTGAEPEPAHIDADYQPVRGETGRVDGVLIFATDVPDHVRDCRQLEELAKRLRESNRLLGRLRDANVLGVGVATEEGIQEANDAYLDIIGYTRDELEAGRITWAAIIPPEWADAHKEAVEQLRETGTSPPYDKELLHRDGHRVPVVIGAAALEYNPLRWTKFVVDLTARQRGDQERAELLAREQAARMAADAAQDQLALLLGAANLVAATGNREELRDQLAQLLVPTMADSCTVLLPADQGMLRAAAVAHRDPARAVILQELRAIDIPPNGPLLQAALTQASTQLVTDVSAVLPGWTRAAPEVTDILQRVRLRSMVVMPLQRVAGAVVLGRDDGRPRFTDTDVAVIEEVDRRLAAGWANLEAFAREHTVAETLQHALLPGAPPEIAGLDVAVRYLPATDGVHIGGDWYDVFPLGRDRVALVIGDVAGHSIGSASIMGQIRSLLRAYTLDYPAPADVLRRTNAAVCELLPDAVATVFYAVLDLPTGDLAYASAGHPPALLDSGEGHVGYLHSVPGPMLGVIADADYTVSHGRVAPGARLLLYTDGLIEDRQRDIAEGFGALARSMRRSRAQTAEQVCQFTQTAMLGAGTRADDVCILAIRLKD